MARKRDYEDGDFDPPKRSSPYQNISDDEYEDDYDDTYDDYDDEEAYTSSSVKKGARKGVSGFAMNIRAGSIVLHFMHPLIINKKNRVFFRISNSFQNLPSYLHQKTECRTK